MRIKSIKPIVFDLDDLCDKWNPWDTLHKWKERNPNGKVTMFAIPRRCSDRLLAQYEPLDWVELAMHGAVHTTGECLYWTAEDTVQKLNEATSLGFINGFKAPKWLITDEVYRGLQSANWWCADHKMNSQMYAEFPDVPKYVYNSFTRKTPYRSLHGHTHNVCDNGIDEAFGSFCVPPERTFKFVSEVVK